MRVAVGEGVEPCSEHDRLAGPARDRRGEGVLGEAMAGGDEESQGAAALALGVGDRLVAVSVEQRPGQWVTEHARSVEVLVHSAMGRGAERGPAGLAREHGQASEPLASRSSSSSTTATSSLVNTGFGFTTGVPGTIGLRSQRAAPV